jgi:phosphotransferase system enzyme I (PtsI)
LLAAVFVGMGAAGLSMGARSIPAVRAALAQVTSEQCEQMAAAALAATGPDAARETAQRLVRP